MLTFNLFDDEWGFAGRQITINPAAVESVVSAERRVNGARWFVAVLTMTSGATHVVTDNSQTVADEIRGAQQAVDLSKRAQAIINDLELKAISANARMAELEGLLADIPLAALLVIEDLAPLITYDKLGNPGAWMKAWEQVSPWIAALNTSRISFESQPEV
jgi:hypothetical protein